MTERPHTLGGPLGVSLAAIVIAAVWVLAHLPPVLTALVSPGLGENEPGAVVAELMQEHDRQITTHRARFDGRSLFFIPPAPSPPKRPEPIVVRRDPPPEVDPGPPPPPPRYTGPDPIAFLGEVVMFRDNLRIRVGEEKNGVTVIAVNAPWTVKLGYRGGEYDVTLFTRNTPFFKADPPAAKPTPGLIEAPTGEAAAGVGDSAVARRDAASSSGRD